MYNKHYFELSFLNDVIFVLNKLSFCLYTLSANICVHFFSVEHYLMNNLYSFFFKLYDKNDYLSVYYNI